MNTETIKKLANFLHSAEKEKREVVRLTKEVYPDFSIEDAYLAQEELVRQKLAEGHKIIGPKMGLTSEAKMKQMNVEDPIYGYVFNYMQVQDGETILVSDYIHPKVEPEIGFVLKEDLTGPNVSAEEVLAKTDYVFPGIEIIDSRYENFDFKLADVIADNTSAAGAVLGTTISRVEGKSLDTIEVSLIINGKVAAMGKGADVLGHPANSVARLANMLARKGQSLKAGQPILTGGITAAVRIQPGDHVCAKFGEGLGEVNLLVK
ncbi:fumarylacetoacetate hydrolase family protein [Bacillus sp. FJAT-27251]|uniref:2-keto-4-pentenoate hydratase n=1 Tax=Bacillus sp. FJAT-27251 TaxID=1684142 RepID=UPI0006A78AA8|nr:fumarylacetoacetate hydrolase family protein [Bacillus sp. FJAT-27251]